MTDMTRAIANGYSLHCPSSGDATDYMVGVNGNSQSARPVGRERMSSYIHDSSAANFGCVQSEDCFIGSIGIEEEHTTLSRSHPITAQIAERRASQHDPGPVIPGECNQSLNRARGKHDALDTNDAQSLSQSTVRHGLLR